MSLIKNLIKLSLVVLSIGAISSLLIHYRKEDYVKVSNSFSDLNLY